MAVINSFAKACLLLLFILLVSGKQSTAAVLEKDQFDVLYHSYNGGGMDIGGPAILVRKKASESVAVSGYYYVDTISSASVDVMSTASPYTEKRNEAHVGVEYLSNKTILALTVGQSDEDDYLAKTVNVNLSHDTFGDLTNVSIGMSYGDDEIGRNGDESFAEQSTHYRLRAGLSQIVTGNSTISLNVEAVADEGYLNNPYRTVRYIDNSVPAGVGYQPEVYPETRNSFATKLSTSYYLPYRAALFASYRYFTDSWQIDAQDFELGYRQPYGKNFEFELKARYYQQTGASFYSDLFEYKDAQNYMARDKELSEFDDITIGLGLSYKIPNQYNYSDWQSEAGIQWDHIIFDYHDFRDPTAGGGIGQEPLYNFSANVVRAFVSVYF